MLAPPLIDKDIRFVSVSAAAVWVQTIAGKSIRYASNGFQSLIFMRSLSCIFYLRTKD
jgi:hypothetical protein